LSIEFYFATHNEHKFKEAESVFAEFDIKARKFDQPIDKLEIQHPNLEEIARTALTLIVAKTKENVFVEDSGLFVH
jgi:inosine/xanthosine triphosphate pyrophosphatase family protein